MKSSTITAIFLLVVVSIFLIGFGVDSKLKNKQASRNFINFVNKSLSDAQQSIDALQSVEPIVNNNYPITEVTMLVNDSMMDRYLIGLKSDYSCQKIQVIDTGEMYLNCDKITGG